MKIIAFGPINSWQIDGEKVETVSHFIFFSSKINVDSNCSQKIKRHLLLGRIAMTNLDSALKNRDITLPTTVRVVKALVFPVVMYFVFLSPFYPSPHSWLPTGRPSTGKAYHPLQLLLWMCWRDVCLAQRVSTWLLVITPQARENKNGFLLMALCAAGWAIWHSLCSCVFVMLYLSQKKILKNPNLWMIESIQAGIWWNLVDHLSVNFLLPDKYSFAMEGNDPPIKV